jgi:hypothetical protein
MAVLSGRDCKGNGDRYLEKIENKMGDARQEP